MNKIIKVLTAVLIFQFLLVAVSFYVSGLITTSTEKKLLVTIPKENIVKIVLTGPGNKNVILEKINGIWALPSQNNFPANQDQIDYLVDRLTKTELDSKISQQKSSHDRLRVSESGFERKVSLFSKNGDSEVIFFGSAPSLRQSHARLTDNNNVHVVKFSANDIDIQPNDWLKKDIFIVSEKDIKKITFGKVTLTRATKKVLTDQPLDATENSDQKPVLSWVPNGLGNKKLSPNAALEFVRKIADMKINGIATQESKNSLDKSNKTYKYTITLLNDEVIVFELLKLQNEEDFLMFTSQRDGVYRLPPLYGKDLILSSSIDALTGSAEKNIDD